MIVFVLFTIIETLGEASVFASQLREDPIFFTNGHLKKSNAMVAATQRLKVKKEKLAVVQKAVVDMNTNVNVKRPDIINLDEWENLVRFQECISSDEEDDDEDKSGSENNLSVIQFDVDSDEESNNDGPPHPQPLPVNAVLAAPNVDVFEIKHNMVSMFLLNYSFSYSSLNNISALSLLHFLTASLNP